MKILLVWPEFPTTFWSFKYALPFIGKKSAFPPLGLLTVSNLLPQNWEKKLIDMNVEDLKEKDLLWADFIFISAMIVQKKSVLEIIEKAKRLNKKIVAGGPLFTINHEQFADNIDHFVLGEAEDIMPEFLKDLKNNRLKKIYAQKTAMCNIQHTPLPDWNLINMKNYASLSIQFSRGCPFNCEFCDIELLNGRFPRVKNKEQILNELESLYQRGWRGNIFFVDDNFIGNKTKLKEEIMPAIIKWMEEKKYPFSFNTQLSVNLADDEALMNLMADAGFTAIFVGIESPDEDSLKECGKIQNTNRDLLESIKIIQNHGLAVQAGFILGFDKDSSSVFDRMTNFIQKSGITTAMVGLLQATPKTKLWERLKQENRLIDHPTGDNTDCTINFQPKMNLESLVSGYKNVLGNIYSPKNYYERLFNFIREYKPKTKQKYRPDMSRIAALWKSIFILGIKEKERKYFWKTFFWTIFRKPKLFPIIIQMAIEGFHFRKISEKHL